MADKNIKDPMIKEDKVPFKKGKGQRRGRGKSTNSQGVKPTDAANAKPCQDSAWYKRIPELMEKASKISFAYPLGDRLRLNNPTLNQAAVPGVMALYITPTIGWCDGPTSPFNVAVHKMYMALRSVWTARSQYDYPDLGMYLIALDSLFSFFQYAKRCYQFAWMTTFENKYYPRALLRASGLDLASIDSELGNFSEWLTYYGTQINQLYLPKELTMTQRHLALFESIWTDDTPTKSQVYMAVPQGFWKFGWDENGVGQLTWKEIMTTVDGFAGPKSFAGLKAIGEELLHNIISYEDFSIIGGDILKAYSPSECFNAVSVITGMPLTGFGPHTNWLDQIHNATMVGYLGTYPESQIITQRVDPEVEGCIIHMPRFTYPDTDIIVRYLNENKGVISATDAATLSNPLLRPFCHMYDNRILDMRVSDPSSDDICEASRWLNIAHQESDLLLDTPVKFNHYLTKKGIAYHTICSDVVNAAVMFYYGGTGDSLYDVTLRQTPAITSTLLLPVNAYLTADPSAALSEIAQSLLLPSRLEVFDRHPYVMMAPVTAGDEYSGDHLGHPYPVAMYGDVCNYAVLGEQELLTLNEAAMASLMFSRTTERRSPLSTK